jgi:hypothetical protein
MSPNLRISLILLSFVLLSACTESPDLSSAATDSESMDQKALTDQSAAGLMFKLEEEGEVLLNSALVAIYQERSEPKPDALLRARDKILQKLEAHASRLKELDSSDLSPEMQAKQEMLIAQLDSRIRDVSREFGRQLNR